MPKPKTSPSNLNPYCVLQRTPCTGNPVGCFHSGKICQNILWMSTRPPPSNAFDFSIQTQQHTHTHTHTYTHTEAGMAGKMCPKCGVQTFFKTPTGRKCSKCEYEMRVPANNGMGGQGCRCSNCGENKVFNNTCRGCGAQFIG